MTIYDYALYRHVFSLMEPDERHAATVLARHADEGDAKARARLDVLVEIAINREQAKNKSGKAA